MQVKLPNREMPVTFRSDDAALVLSSLLAGEPCHIVGIGSVGKSNFLRHIIRSEVKKYHLSGPNEPDRHEKFITVLLDSHNLLSLEGRAVEISGKLWSGYEIMLSRLYRHLNQQNSTEELSSLIAGLKARHRKIFSSNPTLAQSGLRSLENSVYEILNYDSDCQIVFVMDDMEAFRQKLPDEFFESLRGLRDDYKGKVMYLSTARREMEGVMYRENSHWDTVEAFVELFHDHTLYISPLNEEDLKLTVGSYVERNRYERYLDMMTQDQLATDLYRLTGGHAGLVRRCFHPAAHYHVNIMQNRLVPNIEDLRKILLADEGVNKECLIIINSLNTRERFVILCLIEGKPIENAYFWDLQTLIGKHIISADKTLFTIPLLLDFIMREKRVLKDRE